MGIFFLDLHVSRFFFNTWTFMCPFLFFSPCFWACIFPIYLFFYIAHASFFRRTGERYHYAWSFILWMDGMEWLTSSVEVEHVECTWSWSSKYEKYLTRVTQFDEAQCKNKAHMYMISLWRLTYGFGRTNTRACKVVESSLLKKKSLVMQADEARILFIKLYQTSQQLKHYGFPKIWFTSSGLAKNKIYASQSNLKYVWIAPLSLILVISNKFHLNSLVREGWGIECTKCRDEV